MLIKLPFPPTVNHYWGVNGKRRFVTAKGQAFRLEVLAAVNHLPKFGDERLAMTITAVMPTHRKIDLDNLLKAPLDALQHASLYNDDEQLDFIAIVRGQVEKPGWLEVTLQPSPKSHEKTNGYFSDL